MLKLKENVALDVIAMGRASVDFVPDTYGPTTQNHVYTKFLGGSPANTAVAMAQQGIRVGYIGKVGNDILGDYLRSYMAGKGIDVSHIAVCKDGSVHTGLSIAELLGPNNKRSNLYRSDAADLYISMDEMDETYIAGARILLFSGTSLCNSPAREAVFLAIEYARRNGTLVAFDPDYRAQSWKSEADASLNYWLALQKSDILIATREEMSIVEKLILPENEDDDASARLCMDNGVQLVVIKRGEDGATGYTAEGEKHHQGMFPSRVISLQGAGDSYSGTFCSRLVRGACLSEAMKYAAASAALTVSGRSCSEHMPTYQMTKEFVAVCEAGHADQWEFWS